MGKLVKLRFKGGFQDGFAVSAGIGEDEYPYSYKTEIPGAFPPCPEIPACYERWRSAWKVLDKCLRGSVGQGRAFNTADLKGECREAADELRKCVSAWFDSGNREFQTFKERLYWKLGETGAVRVLIQTSDPHLRKLPWHEWNLFADICMDSEFALCGPEYDHAAQPGTRDNGVRILAILGNDEGINITDDRDLLKCLAGKNAEFLSKPKLGEVSDQLWEKAWDILFFAGHSSSQHETGRMYINETDSLTVERLKSGLRTAIRQGLQLAIFNSCDGLKLAEDLAGLNIPQVIIMREPVPNRMAQAFLRYFLRVFSQGKSLYLSVREARERLHENFDDEYPGVGWVPAICQNPVAEPLCWGKPPKSVPPRSVRIDKSEPIEKEQIGNHRICKDDMNFEQKTDSGTDFTRATTKSLDTKILDILHVYFQRHPGDPKMSYNELVRKSEAEPADVIQCLYGLREKEWAEFDLTQGAETGLVWLTQLGNRIAKDICRSVECKRVKVAGKDPEPSPAVQETGSRDKVPSPQMITVAVTTDDGTRFEADVPSDTLVDQLLRDFLYYWQPSPEKKKPKKYLLSSEQPGSPAFELPHTLRQAGINDHATIKLVSESLEPDSALGLYIEDAGKQQFTTAVSLNTNITRLAEAFLKESPGPGNIIVELVGGTPESETVRCLDNPDATLFDEGVHDYAVLRIYRDVNQRRR